MELDIEFDQILFKKAYKFLKKWRAPKIDPNVVAKTAQLEVLKPRLTILARALTGAPTEIFRAEHEGGYSGNAFFLPAEYHHAPMPEANVEFYILRVCYLAMQQRLGLNWHHGNGYPLAESRDMAFKNSPLVVQALREYFPEAGEMLKRALKAETDFQTEKFPQQPPDLSLIWGRWMSPSEAPKKMVTPEESRKKDERLPTPTTEIKAPAREEISVLDVDHKAIKDYTLNHSFEKVDTAEEFKGNWRDLDGADELEEHAEALNELDLRHTVRVNTPTHSVYQAEIFRNGGAPESSESGKGFFKSYDEWDGKRKAYRKDYCKVYPTRLTATDADYTQHALTSHRTVLTRLRKKFANIYTEREAVKRQSSGIEPDFEAVVNNFAEIHAKRTPSENIYLSKRRRRREMSILLLLDVSLSTDAYTCDERILDVEKRSVLLFSEILSEYGDRFQIDGFCSQTRNHCNYFSLKTFDESWVKSRDRVSAIEPQGYTRIGPALRHATSLLEKESSREKWIIMLSDGKPNDYDRYEGSYGVSDVRQALREAHKKNVQVHALAVESEAKFYLPQMLGHGGYTILPTPHLLPEALTSFYAALIR